MGWRLGDEIDRGKREVFEKRGLGEPESSVEHTEDGDESTAIGDRSEFTEERLYQLQSLKGT